MCVYWVIYYMMEAHTFILWGKERERDRKGKRCNFRNSFHPVPLLHILLSSHLFPAYLLLLLLLLLLLIVDSLFLVILHIKAPAQRERESKGQEQKW